MTPLSRRLGLFACLSLLAAVPLAAQTLSEIGVNRSHLGSENLAVQQKTFADLAALHATWFRDGPTSGSPQAVANFVEEVRLARAHGLQVLVTLMQMDEDYDIPLVKHSHGWNAKALSKINLAKFRQRLGTLFGALRAVNLSVDAVEFGSEFDSFYYDADVPDGHPATPAEVHTWLRGYGAFLQAGATLVHDPRYYPQAKLITFGMTHSADGKESLLKPARFVAMLRNVDGFDYLDNTGYHVDGFGTHLYPSPNGAGAAAATLLRQDVAALGRSKPIWVTEFGFLDPARFPNAQGETLPRALGSVLAALDDIASRVPVGPLMFYSYNSGLTDARGRLSGLVDADGGFVPAAAVLSARAMRRRGSPRPLGSAKDRRRDEKVATPAATSVATRKFGTAWAIRQAPGVAPPQKDGAKHRVVHRPGKESSAPRSGGHLTRTRPELCSTAVHFTLKQSE